MKVDNARVYNLEEACVVAGFPMMDEFSPEAFDRAVADMRDGVSPTYVRCVARMDRLAASPAGSGHDCALKGILVTANVTASQVWWLQFGRYHFSDIVSSMSKMHRLDRMDASKALVDGMPQCEIDRFESNQRDFREGDCTFEEFLYACPMGLQLTAGIVTNYLELKTIFSQRKSHRLSEWTDFCGWIRGLPHSCWITGDEATR